jgi:CRP-like cAMP-binding protein
LSELLIRKLEVRDAVSDEEKRVLRDAVGAAREIPPDTEFIREGDRPAASTLVLEGYTFRSSTLVSGGRQITSIHVPGDFVDLHSLLIKEMDHGVTTLTRCKVALVPHTTLRRITETQPHLTRLLWLTTLIDAAVHRRWLTAMGRQSALAHTAHLLCELYCRQKEIGLVDQGSFPMPLSQAKLADALGLSAVHTNRVIQELREVKLIEWRGDRVKILDWDGLSRVGEFDPTYLSAQNEPR